jgi:hypothetical protein
MHLLAGCAWCACVCLLRVDVLLCAPACCVISQHQCTPARLPTTPAGYEQCGSEARTTHVEYDKAGKLDVECGERCARAQGRPERQLACVSCGRAWRWPRHATPFYPPPPTHTHKNARTHSHTPTHHTTPHAAAAAAQACAGSRCSRPRSRATRATCATSSRCWARRATASWPPA